MDFKNSLLFKIDSPDKSSVKTYQKKYYRIFLGNHKTVLFTTKLAANKFLTDLNKQLYKMINELSLIHVDMFRIYRASTCDFQTMNKISAGFAASESNFLKLQKNYMQSYFVWMAIKNMAVRLIEVAELFQKSDFSGFVDLYKDRLNALIRQLDCIGDDQEQIIFKRGLPVIGLDF